LTEALTITTAKRDDHQLDMIITLGPERTEQALQRAARLVSKRARIPGFRPGKAPYATVIRLFGREAVLGEVLDELGEEVFEEALEQEKLKPYGQAELEDVEMDPVAFKLVVPLPPTAELGDYRSLRVELPRVDVTEADVDVFVDGQLDERAAWQAVERSAQIGDRVVVDILGTVGDDKIMENTDWEITLREETGWLPGFDEAFVGMSAGEQKSFSLTYPEESASRYKGQTASFEAAVKEVRDRVKPELTDELVAEWGDYTDVADFRARKLAELKEAAERRAEGELNDAALDALAAQATFSYPPVAVEREIEDILRDLRVRVGSTGYSLEDFLRLQGTSLEKYREEVRPAAERRMKAKLAINKLAELEQIEVTAAENEAEFQRLVDDAQNEEQAQAVQDVFASEQGMHLLYHDVLNRKTLARLREIVTGTVSEVEQPSAQEESAPVAAGETESGAEAERTVVADDPSGSSAETEPVDAS
jgi:trigger factor